MALGMPILAWMVVPKVFMIASMVISLTEGLNAFIKWYIQRPRPAWVVRFQAGSKAGFEKDYSFPSSHSQIMSSVFFVIFLGLGSPLVSSIFGAFTIIVGISRVYLGVHFPSDVLAGWICGAIIPYALHSYDAFENFASWSLEYRLATGFLLPLFIYATLFFMKDATPFNPKPIPHYQSNARSNAHITDSMATANPRKFSLLPQDIERYDFMLMTLLGGVLGMALSLEDSSLPFINEVCSQAHIPLTAVRAAVGFAVEVALFVVGLVLVPSVCKKRGWHGAARVAGCAAVVLVALWTNYFSAKLLSLYGYVCV
eukprot:TRINITY_DN1895_c0_g1_i1.p1 TRINITY_DN1895_c0_g1~~TRINITY_DN1895_c0_g1_i1.p1  ORF type:complete len:349 (+),score=48.72 TRINITY_DN1895_c0_g1_i1:111-1049(+)